MGRKLLDTLYSICLPILGVLVLCVENGVICEKFSQGQSQGQDQGRLRQSQGKSIDYGQYTSYLSNHFDVDPNKLLSEVSNLKVSAVEFLDNLKLATLEKWNVKDFSSAFQSYGGDILKKAVKFNDTKRLSAGKDVQFFLYTRLDQKEAIEIWEHADFYRSGLNNRAPVKIICHGFFSDYKEGPAKFLRPAYLSFSPNYPVNIIAIDWSKYAGLFTSDSGNKSLKAENLYFPPARYTETIGRLTSDLVRSLVWEGGVPLSNIHLIGHSLGAHAMGWAGKYFQDQTNGWKIPRITALDAAAPCFENKLASACFEGNYRAINYLDGDFVDAIHTHSRFYGFTRPVGHADFFPNSGISQPGCSEFGFGICSHTRSVELMAASVTDLQVGFVGEKCSAWDAFKKRTCGFNEFSYMGEYCPRTTRGNFYLKTTGKEPFAGVY